MSTISDSKSLPAGQNLASAQYHIVEASSDETIILSGLKSAAAMGVLQNAPTLGVAARLAFLGRGKLVIDADATIGDLFMSDASGRGTVLTLGVATNVMIVAQGLETSQTGATNTAIDVKYMFSIAQI